mgnify:CR=1 FL=1
MSTFETKRGSLRGNVAKRDYLSEFEHCEQFDDRSPLESFLLSCLFSTSTPSFILTMTFLSRVKVSQKNNTEN